MQARVLLELVERAQELEVHRFHRCAWIERATGHLDLPILGEAFDLIRRVEGSNDLVFKHTTAS